MQRPAIVLFLTAGFGMAAIAAQTPAPPRAAFDVVSVKPNASGERTMQLSLQPSGRLVAVNVPLQTLIQYAYQLQDYQMVGGPEWQRTDRFDIMATSSASMAAGAMVVMQPMIQSLLADRFRLIVHRESRDMPIFALVKAKSDGRLGPALTKSTVDCDAIRSAARPGVPQPLNASGQPACGMRITRGHAWSGGFPVSNLLLWLSQTVQRTVVDRTGLTGNYDADVTFTPDLPPGAQVDAPAAADPPSLFTALQEQLGLRLDAQRGPVDVLVIDSAEKPAED
jgi:uncharacterized protein (TIGR03435 family)